MFPERVWGEEEVEEVVVKKERYVLENNGYAL
jgi:hypothetical protein